MPEIKNVFRQGVMNKDDDERIIPNGQYRDAMNIEVSTSEDSEVGTVQNILGNTRVENIIGDGFTCVGAIADEKNDKLYWLVTSDDIDAIIEYDKNGNVTPVLVDVKSSKYGKILNFNPNTIITGINIIDDLLFWTDNHNEPKKINITSCKAGSVDLQTHTDLIVNNTNEGSIREENIVVIKKRPTKAPDVRFIETSFQEIKQLQALNFHNLGVGSNISNYEVNGNANNPEIPDFSAGDYIILSPATAPGTLPQNYQIKLLITNLSDLTDISGVITGYSYSFEVIEIINSFDDELLDFEVVKYVDVNPIFEKEFIRFATRYKYKDGEFSAFSPFTQPVFVSGRFGFHPTRDPYNLGMENKLLNVMLNNLIETGTPEDVIQLDILFKKEDSTTVYSIDSIKPNDPGTPNKWNDSDFIDSTTGIEAVTAVNDLGNIVLYDAIESFVNAPRGKYEITVENIYAALPENQLLRPYDNVPRKALAQEITGNRLVYANYLQNYNMTDDNGDIVSPDISVTKEERGFNFGEIVTFSNNAGKKSIKSLRTYYLGVVYGDEYGRETPVFTSKDASINIPYEESISNTLYFNPEKSLRLTARINGNAPSWAHYFKYYIKQTTGEYYNLTLDRVYKAQEDQNLWISFPSSDRNKIQEGDYFILKKQVDIESIVPVREKIKIIDIKNEAPETIKNNFVSLGTGGGSATDNSALFPDINQQPSEGVAKLLLDAEAWVETEGGLDLSTALTPSDRLAVQFAITQGGLQIRSKKYFVSAYSSIPGGNNGLYQLLLQNTIDPEDSWVESSLGVLNSTAAFRITIFKLQEKDVTEFEGRFFVKVISNPVTQQYLVPSIQDTDNFRVLGKVNTFTLTDRPGFYGSTLGIFNTQQGSFPNAQNTGNPISNTESEWDAITVYDPNDNSTSEFFIDYTHFASSQEDTGTNIDVSREGRMYKGNSMASINQYINGLEGFVTPTFAAGTPYGLNATGGALGARHWSSSVIRWIAGANTTGTPSFQYQSTFDSDGTYIPSPSGGHFMHLSISTIGEDLHDGTMAESGTGFFAPDSYILGTANTPSNAQIMEDIRGNLQKIFCTESYVSSGLSNNPITGPNLYSYSSSLQNAANTSTSPWYSLSALDQEISNNQFNPEHNNPYNASVISNLIPGNRFTIGDDPEIYTIIKVNKKLLYNHTAWNLNPTYGFNATSALDVRVDDHGNSGGIQNVSVCEAWTRLRNTMIAGGSITTDYLNFRNVVQNFGKANNRRVCYIIELDKNPTSNPETLNSTNSASVQIRFVDNYLEDGQNTLPSSPAIFETEAKEEVDLNIYYEASDYIPVKLRDTLEPNPDSKEKGYLLAPIGTKVTCTLPGADIITDWDGVNSNFSSFFPNYEFFAKVLSWNGNLVTLSSPGFRFGGTGFENIDYQGQILRFTKEDGSYTEAVIKSMVDGKNIEVEEDIYKGKHGLSYYNCFSFGNGVESNRIRDDFNQMFIRNGVKASAVLEEPYEEERRKYGLIYSGLYNSTSGVNNLNQFIQAEKITKDVNPTFGSIQKLYSRTKDLVTLCEDKVLQIFVDRDLLFNADGQQQLLASNRFLGTVQPFRGNYGISKNPESFAAESFRAYFTDKQRGAVLRLSMDGLTPISDAGMKDYFRDNLPDAERLLGSYDSYKGDYNICIINPRINNKTVTYNEKSKGWVSFKSYIPEFGISSVNQYYTFDKGKLWKHHTNQTRNTFYEDVNDVPGSKFVESSVTPVLNSAPELVKHFNTINYEGTQSRIDQLTTVTNTVTTLGDELIEDSLFSDPNITPYSTNFQFADNSGNAIVSKQLIDGQDTLLMYLEDGGGIGNADALNYVLQGLTPGVEYQLNISYIIPSFLASMNLPLVGLLFGETILVNNVPTLNFFYQNVLQNNVGNLSLNFTPSEQNVFIIFVNPNNPHINAGLTVPALSFGAITKLSVANVVTTTSIFTDFEYYNLQNKPGWYVYDIHTNKQKGTLNEFIEKEGKWHNYIKGTENHVDPAAFNFQGLGIVDQII